MLIAGSNAQVMFYSDRRTSGAGFRLDTTCFKPSVLRWQNEVAHGNEVKQQWKSCVHAHRSTSICIQLYVYNNWV